jgi:uncharacterized protein YchJ
MNTDTGMLRNMDANDFKAMPEAERAKYVPVNRPLTVREQTKQKINMYAPCGCGSGKKFKFCCHRKPEAVAA